MGKKKKNYSTSSLIIAIIMVMENFLVKNYVTVPLNTSMNNKKVIVQNFNANAIKEVKKMEKKETKKKKISYKEKEKNVLNAKTSKKWSNGSWKNMIPIKMVKLIIPMI